jgi:hypothetical protein
MLLDVALHHLYIERMVRREVWLWRGKRLIDVITYISIYLSLFVYLRGCGQPTSCYCYVGPHTETVWTLQTHTVPISCTSWQDTHLNPTGQSTMKVNLAAQVMSHTVAASLNTQVAADKEQSMHCMLLLWMKWLIMRTSFKSYCPENLVVVIQMSLSSFINSENVYQYTNYVKYVTNINVLG